MTDPLAVAVLILCGGLVGFWTYRVSRPRASRRIEDGQAISHIEANLAKHLKSINGKDATDQAREIIRLAQSEREEIERQQREAEAAKRREERKAKHARTRKKLIENDNTAMITDTLLNRLETRLREEMPEDELEQYNVALRAKSGSLTYRDIAAIAIIHRESVRHNANGQCPFSRYTRMSAKCEKIGHTFDNRQVRYALDILSVLDFTAQVAPHAQGHFDKDGKYQKGTAGAWTLIPGVWDDVFLGH
jgi:hypothetical protein